MCGKLSGLICSASDDKNSGAQKSDNKKLFQLQEVYHACLVWEREQLRIACTVSPLHYGLVTNVLISSINIIHNANYAHLVSASSLWLQTGIQLNFRHVNQSLLQTAMVYKNGCGAIAILCLLTDAPKTTQGEAQMKLSSLQTLLFISVHLNIKYMFFRPMQAKQHQLRYMSHFWLVGIWSTILNIPILASQK